ncbi:MAG TPA: hypothetical protein PLV68_13320, partial [Ilumatobacteraceae bacterium]|nr:hypothetical protein [Ilumatobacteraceae bacterium]
MLRRAKDIAARARSSFDPDAIDPDRSGPLLVLAYPDRLAARRNQPGQFQLRTGAGAWIERTDPLA